MRIIGSPTITFWNGSTLLNVSTTLQPNADYSGWIDNEEYRASYNVLASSDVFPSITIDVTGAHDLEMATFDKLPSGRHRQHPDPLHRQHEHLQHRHDLIAQALFR
jgi:hypothetical protein